MKIPFTKEEINKAIKSLKNNRSTGGDGVKAELLKYGPEIFSEEIAIILNETAKTGEHPKEIVQGILSALQKPGKARGPTNNLRPITLLSMLRKILAICIVRRAGPIIDQEIPISQAAYREGRSTTEHAFATKILAEKATTSQDYEIYLLLMDMSKAFDTINRKTLMEDLAEIVDLDILHLIKILLSVQIAIKCGGTQGFFFKTDTGAPQGDCLSAIEFTFYLAKTLQEKPMIEGDHTYCKQEPQILEQHIEEHNYSHIRRKHIDINQEYADDISEITSDPNIVKHIKQTLPPKLKARNLNINEDKTEEYKIERKGDDSWKTCKLLGSLLDTPKDIQRRKGLAINALRSMKDIFNSKRLNVGIKTRVFNVYITSIFLYNSEIWTLNKTEEKKIDAFQRRLLRTNVLNIKWPKKCSNTEVYERTNQTPWSKTIQKRRFRWFGHLMRLDERTPARQSLEIAFRPAKMPRGRPKTTWILMMTNELKEVFGKTWQQASEMAQDRDNWRIQTERACAV